MNPNQKETQEAVFIDEKRKIHRGEEALALIQARGVDTVDPSRGVVRVNEDRWNQAQVYERGTWMEGIAAMSDRNEEHEMCYGGYHPVRGKHFQTAIELGCGPFTNIRKVLRHCQIDEIDLLDPLASDYLNHPFCRFKSSKLGGVTKTSLIPWSRKGGFKHPIRFVRNKLEEWRVGGLFGRPVTLHSTSIERFAPPKQYDLCVMLNVIEHCQDVEVIFSKILEMTHAGSYLLFADKIYNASSEVENAKRIFDAGHPIKIDYSFLKAFLMENFDPVWNNEVELMAGADKYRCAYFAGIRKP